jgi:hypothetical protein
MKSNRKMTIVSNQVKASDEDALDIAFWLAKHPRKGLLKLSGYGKITIHGPMVLPHKNGERSSL